MQRAAIAGRISSTNGSTGIPPAARRPTGMGLEEATHVPAHPGPARLETVGTLIMAGIADDRADAIRLVLPRFREQPEYEQLRERFSEIDRLRAEC